MSKSIVLWDKNKVVFDLVETKQPDRILFLCNTESYVKAEMLDREIAFIEREGSVEMVFKLDGVFHTLAKTQSGFNTGKDTVEVKYEQPKYT
tara:strand:- start:32 stop:307 length:276 start_codon:yes stop_codon:yes gene_type:complete